jgi:CheY-like chemotaxis protein/AraC-like DNA-binding protein
VPRTDPRGGQRQPQTLNVAGARVLVVDDDPNVLSVLERRLALEGVEVDTAASGVEALKLARRRLHDALILDLIMPGLSGLDLLAILRSEGIWVPVVILTGHPDATTAFRTAKLGAVQYLTKPARGVELVEILARSLGGWSTRRRESRGVRPLFGMSGGGSSAAGGILRRSVAEGPCDPTCLRLLLVRAMGDRGLTLHEFLAVGRGLRLLVAWSDADADAVRARIAKWLEDASARDSRPGHSVVGRFLFQVETAGRYWSSHDEDAVSGDVELDWHIVRSLLTAEVGLEVGRCRTLFALRRAALELAGSREQVKLIAIRAGYDWVPNFNRDFQDCLAMSPTEFRRATAEAADDHRPGGADG